MKIDYSLELTHLAAIPDELIDKESILEITFLWSIKKYVLEGSIKKNKKNK